MEVNALKREPIQYNASVLINMLPIILAAQLGSKSNTTVSDFVVHSPDHCGICFSLRVTVCLHFELVL